MKWVNLLFLATTTTTAAAAIFEDIPRNDVASKQHDPLDDTINTTTPRKIRGLQYLHQKQQQQEEKDRGPRELQRSNERTNSFKGASKIPTTVGNGDVQLERKGGGFSKGRKAGGSSSSLSVGKTSKGTKKGGSDDEIQKVIISIQPAYHGIPMFMAQEMGWFEELGIEAQFSVFSSGGPQVAAAADEQAWDIGIAGSPPNILAGFVDILTIGINNDEGAANIVYGAPGVTEFPPTELTPGMFATTASSTGDLIMRLCLEAEGVDFTDEHFVSASQGDIITALEANQASYGALWAPNAYTYQATNQDAVAFCNGQTVGLPVLGGIMVRKEFADDNPEVVARVLAAYLRGVTTLTNQNARAMSLEMSRAFYEDFIQTTVSMLDMERDLLTRPVFNLDDQLTILDRNLVNNQVSEADAYYSQLIEFMFEQGVLTSLIEPSAFITDYYMKLVSSDPALRRFSYLGSETHLDESELEKVNISVQPAYHGIPMFMAQEMGWFEELGLEVEITVYSSGGPQVQAAADDQAWDIGIAGSPPNVVAGFLDILTIGINNDEGATTFIYGAPGVTEFPPTELTPGMFATTPTSTGDLLMRLCLEAEGVDFTNENFVGGSQGEIIDALETNEVSYGALWAPNAYIYEGDNPEATAFCSGESVSLPILGGIMVRKEYADTNPDIVARILAAYLRGVTTMTNRNARGMTLAVSRTFYEEFIGTTSVTVADMERDLLSRPLFNLDEQLKLMDRNFANGGESEADLYYSQLAQFMFDGGVIDSFLQPDSYITDFYMKIVSDNPGLREFAFMGAYA